VLEEQVPRTHVIGLAARGRDFKSLMSDPFSCEHVPPCNRDWAGYRRTSVCLKP
jgi:hypothetical protein